ncbi:hypothetical protein [Ignavibacterium album]|uniref:hypothetical protein n=1 Tax=Ignavibacterium album TaxID=591197 RepID=UPI0035B89791
MTINEFNVLNEFVLENLKKENPFVITTSRLFKVIGYDISLRKGHNSLYDELIRFCNEVRPPYNVKAFYRSEDSDDQFDIEFRQL